MSKLVTVSGCIGAGKTTFINAYADYLRKKGISVCVYLEPVDDNELLVKMYEDPSRWMFTSQVNFLVDKLRTLEDARSISEYDIVLIERDIKEQLIFIEAQKKSDKITDLEYKVYVDLYNSVQSLNPDVINYHIDISYETSLEHISVRGRECESLIDEEYYKILHDEYRKVYSEHDEQYIILDNLSIDTYERITKQLLGGVFI